MESVNTNAMTREAAQAIGPAPLIVTRARVPKDRRFLLLPPVQRWISDQSRRKLAVKSRRVGWTYGEAYDAIASRKTGARKFDYWYTCTDKDSAREFTDYCAHFIGLKAAVAEEALQIETPTGNEDVWAFVVRPTKDTKIVAMPSRPAALRGKSGDVGCDEFAFHQQAAELYKAAVSVTKWGGSLRLWSTHNGDATLFNVFDQNCRRVLAGLNVDADEWRGMPGYEALLAQARAMKIRPVFSHHFCDIFRAIDEGLVELLNTVTGSSHTRESFLAECREECIDEAQFQQEYGGRPAAAGGQWLSLMQLSAAYDSECPAPDEPLRGYTGGPAYVGVDFARNRDRSVVWVLEKVGDVLWTRQIKRLDNMSTPDQAQVLATILRSVRFAACSMDMTGNGLGLFEYTQKSFGGRVHGVNFAASMPVGQRGDKEITQPIRQVMATTLRTLLDERRMRIPGPHEDVQSELLKLKATYLASGAMTFAAARDKNGHADHFWALALAAAGAVQVSNALTGPSGVTVEPREFALEGL